MTLLLDRSRIARLLEPEPEAERAPLDLEGQRLGAPCAAAEAGVSSAVGAGHVPAPLAHDGDDLLLHGGKRSALRARKGVEW